MRMHIYEAWCNDLILHIYDARSGCRIDSSNPCDSPVLNSQVCAKPWIAAAVDNPAIGYHQIECDRLVFTLAGCGEMSDYDKCDEKQERGAMQASPMSHRKKVGRRNH